MGMGIKETGRFRVGRRGIAFVVDGKMIFDISSKSSMLDIWAI